MQSSQLIMIIEKRKEINQIYFINIYSTVHIHKLKS